MDAKTAYEHLVRRGQELAYLGAAGSLAGWDQRTYIPEKGHAHRARVFATLSGHLHRLATDPAIGEWLAAVEGSALMEDADVAANVRNWRRDYDRAVRVPEELAVELARAAAEGESAWHELREKDDWESFVPYLERIVELKKRYAEAVGYANEPYDALLEDFEPGSTAREVEALFAELKPKTLEVLEKILASGKKPDPAILAGHYPKEKQRALSLALLPRLGYDLAAGRLDETLHPFAVRIHPGDVRITTKFVENDLTTALFGTIHEAGHAMYEQGLPEAAWGTPLGEAASYGVHESQSRMWENLVGRSLAFWRHFYPTLQAHFPKFAEIPLEAFVFAVNEVRPSLIRTEADEVTYNLHILLRFELELALFRGEINVRDLPEAWNAKMEAYLGVRPERFKDGVMQDVHWSGGAFGYFPSYTLGNLYAAQLFEAAEAALGELGPRFAEGEFAPLLGWLRAHVHAHGRRYAPKALIERATGRPPSAEPWIRYLNAKYGALYGF